MSTVWTQRREDLLSDCIVSPDVFNQMVDRVLSQILLRECLRVCYHPSVG